MAFALEVGTDWDLGPWLVLALAGKLAGQSYEIGTTGPLMLVGFGVSHCPWDGLVAPLRISHDTTVRLQRNKFYLIYIHVLGRSKICHLIRKCV